MDSSFFTPIIESLTSAGGLGGGLVLYLIMTISLFMIAQQEREEFAWFAFIPLLNLFLMCKIGRINPLLLLIFIVPCFTWLLPAFVWAKVGETREKSLWGWLMIIPCFWFISPIVIALGKK
jgi:hypothetical protein